jgi:hypothetical protein
LRRNHGTLGALRAIRDPAIRRRAIRATELIGAPPSPSGARRD